MNRLTTHAFLLILIFLRLHARADGGVEVTASQSLTIQPSGPRQGPGGGRYFNVEGKANNRYASFGVLVFDLPKEALGQRVKGVTLMMVQSIPGFARDGGVTFFLAPDLDPKAELKFDPNAPDGIGGRIKPLHGLGSGRFKKVETGKSDLFPLTVDEAVSGRIARGGRLCLVVVPADGAVAATYFGAGQESKENRPRLRLDLP
jgi:hypothetical protein